MAFKGDLPADVFTADDVQALREIGGFLWDKRHEIATEWSRRLMTSLPEYFSDSRVPDGGLVEINEVFLTLVLQFLTQGDLRGLFETYYSMNRVLVESNLRESPTVRISLSSLYTSLRISSQVVAEELADD